jgi:3-oxoacyl-[acyl-carrier protein] reductase
MTASPLSRGDALRVAAGAALAAQASAAEGDDYPSSWPDSVHASLKHPSLKDRPVIVTGGNRGFGWFMARELLAAGARVAITGRNLEALKTAAARAERIAGPGKCLTIVANVTKPEDCARTVAETLAAFGRFDVLINNAGVSSLTLGGSIGLQGNRVSAFHEASIESGRAVIETNLLGVFYMTKAAMPHFVGRKFGKVFSISTSLGNMVRPGNSFYGASKAGLEVFHRVWAAEMKGTGIDVNILLPGGASDTEFIPDSAVPGAVGTRAGRLLPGDIIVPPAVWLATDATNGVTGERIMARLWDKAAAPDVAFKGCLQPHVAEPQIM